MKIFLNEYSCSNVSLGGLKYSLTEALFHLWLRVITRGCLLEEEIFPNWSNFTQFQQYLKIIKIFSNVLGKYLGMMLFLQDKIRPKCCSWNIYLPGGVRNCSGWSISKSPLNICPFEMNPSESRTLRSVYTDNSLHWHLVLNLLLIIITCFT